MARGDALKALAAVTADKGEPSEDQIRAALIDGIDLFLSMGGLGERMTVALEKLAHHPALPPLD